MLDIPDNLPDLTRELVNLRKKPTTQERFKSYPAMLQRFNDLLDDCEDADTLKEVLRLDTGYYLLAGYRQRVLEKLLSIERSAETVNLYAMQLELFGDINEYGEANTDIDERVEALYAEAEQLKKAE
ncbi:MAG: hypothetical protein Q9P44_19960 [Anaerolineae bacterium]|nr:hypothetical protein [Anaerolineae bacterium]